MSHLVDQHLERHLGPIARGWSSAGEPAGVQICLFEDRPVSEVATYATLGLSQHVLEMPRGREVRQELLLSVAVDFVDDDLAKLLTHVAEGVVREHRALLRGEVLPLGHPITRGSLCDSLYVSLPAVFPEELATCPDTQPSTVFAWLIPIHQVEAEFVARLGWNAFEDQLEQADPDIFDLSRPSIA